MIILDPGCKIFLALCMFQIHTGAPVYPAMPYIGASTDAPDTLSIKKPAFCSNSPVFRSSVECDIPIFREFIWLPFDQVSYS